jgi:hypothetical protein
MAGWIKRKPYDQAQPRRHPESRQPASLRTRSLPLERPDHRGLLAKANPLVSRTIQIRGNQTLAKLHKAIFDTFDRDDEHMYEFQISGKGPMDRNAKGYVLPMGNDPFDDQEPTGSNCRP